MTCGRKRNTKKKVAYFQPDKIEKNWFLVCRKSSVFLIQRWTLVVLGNTNPNRRPNVMRSINLIVAGESIQSKYLCIQYIHSKRNLYTIHICEQQQQIEGTRIRTVWDRFVYRASLTPNSSNDDKNSQQIFNCIAFNLTLW